MRKTIALLSVVLTTFFLATAFTAKLADKPAEGYKVGDIVEDFSLKNIDGNQVSLSSMKNTKGIVVVFTCNHCPYAKMYEDRIIALDKQFKEKGFPVVAINPNDTKAVPDDAFDKMQERAKEKGFTFPYLIDETQEIATRFGASRTPHVFLLVKDVTRWKVAYIGAIDDNAQEASKAQTHYVADAITSLLAGGKPTTETTKAIGCTIKWKK